MRGTQPTVRLALAALAATTAACSSGDQRAARADSAALTDNVTVGTQPPLDTALDVVDTVDGRTVVRHRSSSAGTASRSTVSSGAGESATTERTESRTTTAASGSVADAPSRVTASGNTVTHNAPLPSSTGSGSSYGGGSTGAVGTATGTTAAPAPTVRRTTTKHTQRDAAIGAAAGAILGATTSGNKTRGAAIGGAAGAILGGVLGNNVDKKTKVDTSHAPR